MTWMKYRYWMTLKRSVVIIIHKWILAFFQGLLDQEEHPKESLSDFGFQYNLIEDKDEVFLLVSDHIFE